jgi:4a-hydroxytetrahydrobiopterin dehydratase
VSTDDPKAKLRYDDVLAADLPDWRFFLNRLHARFSTGSFTAGLALVTAVTEAAEAANHHPDVVLTYPMVELTLVSHDVGAVTSRDLALARTMSSLAAAQGVAAAPAEVQTLELALDVPSAEEVQPFWAAVLGYQPTSEDPEIQDPAGINNTLWFQTAPSATGDVQQRFHLDIVVPREVAETRVAEALAAGGTLVSEDRVPAYWVLADAHGNKVCVCTADGRTGPSTT